MNRGVKQCVELRTAQRFPNTQLSIDNRRQVIGSQRMQVIPFAIQAFE